MGAKLTKNVVENSINFIGVSYVDFHNVEKIICNTLGIN